MWQTLLTYSALLAVFCKTVVCLDCYRCVSTQPGCGKELNIRLQRWHTCPSPGRGGSENFCVKIIHKKGSEKYILRECLSTIRGHTQYRAAMPTVQRHGYCSPARNNDPFKPTDGDITYCFCNDWNGCNPATVIKAKFAITTVFAILSTVILQFFR